MIFDFYGRKVFWVVTGILFLLPSNVLHARKKPSRSDSNLITKLDEKDIKNLYPFQSKKLRILFVVEKFPYAPRWYINNQITGFIDAGHEVYILADRVGQHPLFPQVKEYNLLERTFFVNIPKKFREFDIIYSQFGGKGNYALKLIIEGSLQGKLVVCFRGGDVTKRLKENPHRYDLLFKCADLFFPVCDHFKQILINHGCDADKIRVCYSCVDCDKFIFRARKKPKKGKIKIITVARLIEMKGLEDSIKAIEKLKDVYPNIRYDIIGEGPEEVKLKKLISDRNLSKYVKLVGYLEQDQVIEKYYKAHICLHTPLTTNQGEQEGLPNSVKEAMLTGLPVVATDHGAMSELVHDGITGYLVPEKGITMMVKRLIYLIENSHNWPSMGYEGSKYVRKNFCMKKLNRRLIKYFYQLAN